jgi:quaternary ammonium compound-resistance protein SugE
MTAWTALLLAGCFEVGFTTALKLSEQFTRWPWTLAFLLSAGTSFLLLSVAVRTLPMGTAYAVWTGIGAAGTVLVGIVAFGEPASAPRLLLLALLVASILGLRLVG